VHSATIYRPEAEPPVLDKSRKNSLVYSENDTWTVFSDTNAVRNYTTDDIRWAVVYRARCFASEEEKTRYANQKVCRAIFVLFFSLKPNNPHFVANWTAGRLVDVGANIVDVGARFDRPWPPDQRPHAVGDGFCRQASHRVYQVSAPAHRGTAPQLLRCCTSLGSVVALQVNFDYNTYMGLVLEKHLIDWLMPLSNTNTRPQRSFVDQHHREQPLRLKRIWQLPKRVLLRAHINVNKNPKTTIPPKPTRHKHGRRRQSTEE
jgi:hypothetical protein